MKIFFLYFQVLSRWKIILNELPKVCIENMYGIIDKNGTKVIPIEYNQIGSFYKCFIWASKDGNTAI